jgi:hypothetical protein
MFIGLNKTTQKHGRRKRKIEREKIKSYVLKQMYFSVIDENAIALKYFDLRTSSVWRFRKSERLPEDGQVWPKHVAVDCDFNVILN